MVWRCFAVFLVDTLSLYNSTQMMKNNQWRSARGVKIESGKTYATCVMKRRRTSFARIHDESAARANTTVFFYYYNCFNYMFVDLCFSCAFCCLVERMEKMRGTADELR